MPVIPGTTFPGDSLVTFSSNEKYIFQDCEVITEITREELLRVLNANSWFNSLPAEICEAMLNLASVRSYDEGDIIHYQGDPSRGFYGIVKGAVKVSSTAADGRECVFRYLSPGNWFGEIGIIDRSVRTHDARVLRKTLLLILSPHDLGKLLEVHPAMYHFLSLLLCKVVRNAFTLLHETSLLSVSAQLAKRLSSLAEAYGQPCGEGVEINLHLTQDDLATIINTTRQTINKRLVEWEKLGWIEARYGNIIIKNSDALKQLFEE